MDRSFYIVDVFGSDSFTGNPVAVVFGADELSKDKMQQITQWFNLSETTFIFAPENPRADYRVRIFALEGELPFAGHPTLGSCGAWLAHGNKARDDKTIIQECGSGLVKLRYTNDKFCFAAPDLIRSGPPSDEEFKDALEFLGLDAGEVISATWLDNGPGWLGFRLSSAEKVLALNPHRAWPHRMDIGVVGLHPVENDAAVEVRAFFTDHNGSTIEDPVTGSLNASIAQWLFATRVLDTDYVATQGSCIGRKGRVFVSRDKLGQVWVGGNVSVHVSGKIVL
ncbi:PhzF family phenazine biosynthesis protein [Ochrobactrum quorumnocens]|uniref:PhzF family phenazine biosynthesis protein n=1 Tax=Ochrobactrum quorumnocens TaxID=271865 RepID=UPI003B9ED388